MASVGQRGKWAENQVRTWMKNRSDADAKFDFYRFPDARAGSFATVPADFETMHQGSHALIEVKEVKVTTANGVRRLKEGNFSADKVARMHKREMAGAECWLVLCHITPVSTEWRLVPLSVFLERQPSWDVTSYPVHLKVRGVMAELYGSAP